MLGKITSIKDNNVYVALNVNVYDMDNIIGKNVVFDNHIIGEVSNMSNSVMEVSLIGEINDNKFIYGNLTKPSFKSECRIISGPELDIIYNVDKTKNVVKIGKSFLYNSYDVYLNINSFFANHFAILGNTGSGKSYSVSRLLQGIFYDAKRLPYNTNIFLFDAYGEYQRAFVNINQVNPNLNYKVYTTDLKSQDFELLRIPFWLLGVDDICLLLNVNDTRQIPIIEKALKLVCYFCKNDESVIKQKNDIIARSLLDVIFSGKNHSETRNKIVSILSKFSTNEINLEIKLVKGGWARSLRQCIYVEESGNFADIELVISYLEGFCMDDFELSFPDGSYAYTIKDFYTSLEFALISEGIFNSNKVFDYANILKIRLNSLMNSDYVNYFIYDRFITKEQYINTILAKDNGKAQIINFNINYVDDRFAKVIVKIHSKLLFDYIVKLPNRGSISFHIILEEAHRYVQNDTDVEILGYNIFERITKEGRKYGIILGLISQRPSEISETAISQCSNFIMFKMFHPKDLKFVSDIIPNISETVLSRIKVLHPGSCMMFGTAFPMPILTIVDKPNPEPLSQSCNIDNTWYVE
jgi:DNA helicase HerA-like ATPase